MTYVSVESSVETMLKAAFVAALADAGVSATVRGWWIYDSTGDSEDIAFPQVNIMASPNVPDGWRQTFRRVPVQVEIVTFQPDDQKRQTLLSIYDVIRQDIDETDYSSASFTDVPAVVVDDGGTVGEGLFEGGPISVIQMLLTVDVCLA